MVQLRWIGGRVGKDNGKQRWIGGRVGKDNLTTEVEWW